MTTDKKIGQILLDQRLISVQQLAEALSSQKMQVARGEKPLKLGQILALTGVISLPQLQTALREQKVKASESRKIIEEVKVQLEIQRKPSNPRETDPRRQSKITRWAKKFFKSSKNIAH